MYNKEVHDLKAELARQDFIAQVYKVEQHRPSPKNASAVFITQLYYSLVNKSNVPLLLWLLPGDSRTVPGNIFRRKYSYMFVRKFLSLNSALLTGLKCFEITWTISTTGLKRYTIRSRHWFPEVKKPSFCFLVINSHYHACSNKSW